MKNHDPTTQRVPSDDPVDEHFERSGRSGKTCVLIVDQRDFLGGCLSSWLDEAHGEFLTVVVPDITLAFENEHSLNAAAAILSVSSMATGLAWLEKQIALIRGHSADLPIVIIMDEDEEAHRPGRLASLGVQGYIPTSSNPDVALAALRLVIAGGCYYPHSGESAGLAAVPSNLTSPGDQAIQANAPNLTRREWEVLELIANGLPNKIIAYRLGLALGTVKIHVHHIIDKLKVKNRTGAALWGREFHASGQSPTELSPTDLTPTSEPERCAR